MSKEDIKNEFLERVVRSWGTTLLGVGLCITMVILGSTEKIQWSEAYGWFVVSVGLITRKDKITKI